MKITRNEFGHEYKTYHFGYCEYAFLEKGDRPVDFYTQGFLPHTADPSVKNRFYMARSARVPLKRFSLTSENRRIAKRFEGTFTIDRISPKDAGNDIRKLFLEYFAKRHGPNVMPKERLEAILTTPLPLQIITYKVNGELIAAVLEIAEDSFGHFYFSAYDLSLMHQSLGMWLMLDCALQAKKTGSTHYYLGTVYGEKALYKTNLEPLEFWDGCSWNSDIRLLKKLARAESK